ncbi:MAG: hypothetical protein O7J95_04200, partial [Planctomycetota bacterium]|nr:hypothetical protein [Planctomycetota bacterium]
MNWLRNNWLVGSLWIACGGLVISLGVAVWLLFENGLVRTIYRDRGSLRLEARSVRVRHVVWGPATEIPDEPPERGSAAPSDGPPQSLLFLALPTPRGDRDIFVRHRRADGWSAPRPLDGPEDGGVNTTSNELSPVLARDGERLYFASDRAGGHGGLDLWSARRVDGGWSEPRNLGRRVNSPFDDGSPAIHPGGQILVYATNRPVGFLLSPPDDWRDVSLEGRTKGPGNLGMSAAALRGDRLYWSTPVVLGGINSSADDVAPCFSPAGDFLYFASDRAGGQGGYDLYRSAVVGAPEDDGRTVRLLLEAPDNLGRPVNSFEDERRPRPIDQGFALLFERKAGASEKTSLLESRSVEVEKRLEIAQLPLAAVAADVVRLLIFALTALVVAVCTVWLLRTRRRWAVNLLVRCAAVALLIHLAMLYGFYFWKVSRHLVALAEKERQEEISLESSLAAQISVEVSRQDIDVPEPDARRLDMAPLAEWPEEALEPAPPRVDRSPADDLPHLETIQLTVASVTRPRIPDDPPPRRPLPRPERERRHEAALLPELERVPVERDLEVEPSLERETSQRVDAETARSTRLERLETTIAAPTPSPRRTDLELARTAVLGPQPSPLLPPVARTPVDVESRLARLPVPAARARDDDAPRPSRSPSVPASVWNAALGDPPKPL